MHHKVTSFSGAEPLKTDSSVIGWVGKAHGPSQNFGGPLTKLRIKPPARDSRYTNFCRLCGIAQCPRRNGSQNQTGALRPHQRAILQHCRRPCKVRRGDSTTIPSTRLEARLTILVSRTARNSRPLEVIGTYDPIPKKDTYDESGRLHKDIKLDTLRAKYWIGVGAQPTDTVWRLLSMVCS